MNNVMGIIMTGGSNLLLKELARNRSASAVPVGGRYRAIDFVLSNMVNSGIRNVGVITQYNFRSLMDHLDSGREWDLDRKNDGLFFFPPYLSEEGTGWYKGTADAMYHNLTFLKRSNEEYVIVAQGNGIYKMLFDDMLQYHLDTNADITLAYKELYDYSPQDLSQLGILEVDHTGRLLDFQEKPLAPKTIQASLGIYLMKREFLIDLLEECAAHGDYDFVKDIIIKKVCCLRVMGYPFKGYWRGMNSVDTFYRCNMELLNPEVRHELFFENGSIFTKVKDEAPAKYNAEANVRNSIIADGCIIEGKVENSILFRGVYIQKGAAIKDSIIMQNSVVEEGCTLQNVILDKSVLVTHGRSLKGEPSWPVIVGKNTTV